MKARFFLLLIGALALILRFWMLGSNPASLDWDEASLGYNAYSILTTGKDEYGSFLPISIRSFNDFKPPLYTYVTILPVMLLGLTELSVRLVSSVFGLIAIVSCYFLAKELFNNKKLSLLSSFFLAVSPWHIQFSRIAFEANAALTLIILGVLFFLKGLRNSGNFILSAIFFGFSLYAYHSPRLIVPILIIGLIFIYFSNLKSKLSSLFIFFAILLLFAAPIVFELKSATAARFSSVSVINPNEKLGDSIKAIEFDAKKGDILGRIIHNRRIVFAREIIGGYLDHFNFDFLFLSGDPPGRHHAADQGMLYFIDLPFVIIGILFILRNIKNPAYKTIAIWFLIAPVASSLTSGTPHAVRAIFYLPAYQLLISAGMVDLLRIYKNKLFYYSNLLIITVVLLYLFNIFYYLHQYYVHTPIEYAPDWQYGYKEAVYVSNMYENNVDKIIVTYRYDQPYVYFLFYNRIDPSWYQTNWGKGEINRSERKFGKYEFRNIDWENDRHLRNVLLIGTGSEIPDNSQGIVSNIYFPDGSSAFKIVRL